MDNNKKEANLKKIQRKVKKWIKDYGTGKEDIDVYEERIKGLYDETLTYNENIRLICEALGIDFNKTLKDDYLKVAAEERKQIRVLEEKSEEIQREAINHIKESETTTILSKAFKTIKEFTKAVVKSDKLHGLILESPTGLGKSYNVIKALTEMGLKIDEDFVVISGYSTPLELYKFLFNHDSKVVVFDDIVTIFESERARGILLSALYHPSGKRIVNYLSSSGKLDVPKTFEFKGDIIWCVNRLPKGNDSIKSRTLYYPFNFSHKELIQIMCEIAKVTGIPSEIIDYIKENSNESVRLDLRLPEKLYEIQKTLNHDWKKYADEILGIETDEEIDLVINLLNKHMAVKDACRNFIELTGTSRATFFRRKRVLDSRKKEPRWNVSSVIPAR